MPSTSRTELPATVLLPTPSSGRTFTAERTVRLGDVDRRGELRLDAVARYLQDVATDDAIDAGLSNAMGWLVRRTLIRIDDPARLNERVTLTTFCTGSGRSWAERRTVVRGGDGAAIDAVSLWVQIDVATGRPARLTDDFAAVYGAAAGGRVVSSKLVLPKSPPADVRRDPWHYRATDVDPFGHVNNAAQWALLEQLLADGDHARTGTGEVEFVGPSDVDGTIAVDRTDGAFTAWFDSGAGVATVLRWTR